jgi:hypothetical protein
MDCRGLRPFGDESLLFSSLLVSANAAQQPMTSWTAASFLLAETKKGHRLPRGIRRCKKLQHYSNHKDEKFNYCICNICNYNLNYDSTHGIANTTQAPGAGLH